MQPDWIVSPSKTSVPENVIISLQASTSRWSPTCCRHKHTHSLTHTHTHNGVGGIQTNSQVHALSRYCSSAVVTSIRQARGPFPDCATGLKESSTVGKARVRRRNRFVWRLHTHLSRSETDFSEISLSSCSSVLSALLRPDRSWLPRWLFNP